jgi:hypothetical protein
MKTVNFVEKYESTGCDKKIIRMMEPERGGGKINKTRDTRCKVGTRAWARNRDHVTHPRTARDRSICLSLCALVSFASPPFLCTFVASRSSRILKYNALGSLGSSAVLQTRIAPRRQPLIWLALPTALVSRAQFGTPSPV